MNEEQQETRHTAHWTDDCQGKQDFDGYAVLISTRYWPGPLTIFDSRQPEKGLHEVPGGKPSAHAELEINIRDEDGAYLQYGYGDRITLAEQDFKADTEEEVKAQVEAWVQMQFERMVAVLRKEFGV